MADIPTARAGRARHAAGAAALGDFTADRRMLLLVAMAAVVGAGGVVGAWALLKLIALFSNVIWRGQISTLPMTFANMHPSLWMVAAPALGGLAIGFMARYGSEKIRGHGIPEADRKSVV